MSEFDSILTPAVEDLLAQMGDAVHYGVRGGDMSGTLSTRTDDDDGVVTVAAGHGVSAEDLVNVLWASGGLRVGMSVSMAAATTVTVSGGSGDALPVVDTAGGVDGAGDPGPAGGVGGVGRGTVRAGVGKPGREAVGFWICNRVKA